MAKGIKTGGRTAGTENHTTKEVRKVVKEVIDNELPYIKDLLNELTARERLDFIIKLLPYVVPKLATELKMNEQLPTRCDFEVDCLNGDGSLNKTYKINNYGNDGTESE